MLLNQLSTGGSLLFLIGHFLALTQIAFAVEIWKPCATGYNGPWASTKVPFPTVESLKSDMVKCGNIGQAGPTIFYSFGATTPQARAFRDTLKPAGNMFNDCLPDDFTKTLAKGCDLSNPQRQSVFVSRYAQAMAEISKGEVFLVVGPDAANGAYTTPRETANVWHDYEFPTLQRNQAITKVTVVPSKPPYVQKHGWAPSDTQAIKLPYKSADTLASIFLRPYPHDAS